ncbi:MAG: NADH-quinone oxidoreductase subunit J, partial [Candidatus Aminicenantales bacterium]
MILQYALLIGLVLFSVLAVLAKDLIKAAIALAAGSLLLGIIFFRMGAPYAGVFEISVVAGLITVLFILTIALTKAEGEVSESKAALWAFPAFFVLFIGFFGVVDADVHQRHNLPIITNHGLAVVGVACLHDQFSVRESSPQRTSHVPTHGVNSSVVSNHMDQEGSVFKKFSNGFNDDSSTQGVFFLWGTFLQPFEFWFCQESFRIIFSQTPTSKHHVSPTCVKPTGNQNRVVSFVIDKISVIGPATNLNGSHQSPDELTVKIALQSTVSIQFN